MVTSIVAREQPPYIYADRLPTGSGDAGSRHSTPPRHQRTSEGARTDLSGPQDGLLRELAGLNEYAPEAALRYAAERLAKELAWVNNVLARVKSEVGTRTGLRNHSVKVGEIAHANREVYSSCRTDA